jgi:hypothetical protein
LKIPLKMKAAKTVIRHYNIFSHNQTIKTSMIF